MEFYLGKICKFIYVNFVPVVVVPVVDFAFALYLLSAILIYTVYRQFIYLCPDNLCFGQYLFKSQGIQFIRKFSFAFYFSMKMQNVNFFFNLILSRNMEMAIFGNFFVRGFCWRINIHSFYKWLNWNFSFDKKLFERNFSMNIFGDIRWQHVTEFQLVMLVANFRKLLIIWIVLYHM